MITITRKIQLNIDAPKEKLKEHYDNIYRWQSICTKAANMIASNLFIQENIKDFFFLEDGTRKKLADIKKDEDGILTTSAQNSTYQLLSKHFKGDCPMNMLSGLNMAISKTYKKEARDVNNGKKSLRSYRNNVPMPIPANSMRKVSKSENGNYTFTAFGVPFKTWFGKDLSGNELILDRAMKGDYKLCDSSILLDGKKMFLLAVFQFDKLEMKLDEEKTAECRLSQDYPIIIVEKKGKLWNIGTAEEFLHRRMAIKAAMSRLQKSLRYNEGGKGRSKKMKAIERFSKLEDHYVETRLHTYSKMLIDYCVKRGIGNIALTNYTEVDEAAKEDTERGKFLLASWSYFGLSDKIKYKAEKVGIKVELL